MPIMSLGTIEVDPRMELVSDVATLLDSAIENPEPVSVLSVADEIMELIEKRLSFRVKAVSQPRSATQ